MNVPPPDDMKGNYERESKTVGESEAKIAKDAERARRHVARRFPDEPKTGKSLWDVLGIGKGGKK